MYIEANNKQENYVKDFVEMKNILERLGVDRLQFNRALEAAGVSTKRRVDVDNYEEKGTVSFLNQSEDYPSEIRFNNVELFPERFKTNKE